MADVKQEPAPPKNQCTCWYHPAAPKPRNADCPEHGVNRPGQGKHAQHEAIVMANEALLKERIRKLSDEVEQLCVQLAGCSTAAAGYGNKPEPLSRDAYGWSVAFDDVCKLYEKKERARLALEPLRAKCARQRRELRRLNDKLVSFRGAETWWRTMGMEGSKTRAERVVEVHHRNNQLSRRVAELESELAAPRAKESQGVRAAQARAIRFAADSAFPSAKRDYESSVLSLNVTHWIALQRWADRVERGEVTIPEEP